MPNSHCDTNLSDEAWDLVAALLPPVLPGWTGTTDVRAVVNAIYSGPVANGGCSRVSSRLGRRLPQFPKLEERRRLGQPAP